MGYEHKVTEEEEHKALCNYIQQMYPDVIFTTDASGVRMHPVIAAKFVELRSKDAEEDPIKPPDIYVLHRSPSRKWSGLLMELKRTGTELYNKDGVTFKDKRYAKQAECLERLEKQGFYATFVIGLDAGVDTVDRYMNGVYD